MGFVAQLIIAIVVFVAGQLLLPKPDIEDAKPAGIGDFKFPTATEGRVVPLLWGTVRISGPNVVWYGDLSNSPITERQKVGLFKKVRFIRGYRYNMGVQYALCRGPVDEFLGLWIGDEKVFEGSVVDGGTFTVDEPDLFGGNEIGNGGWEGTFKFFSGPLVQVASSYLSQHQQEGGDTPGYNGLCYLAPDAESFYVGNSESIKAPKFEVRRIPNGLGLATPGVNGGADANPMNVLYEVMTDTSWGLAIDPVTVDGSGSFTAAATTLESEGNGFSFLLDRSEDAIDMIRRIMDQVDGALYYDASAGLWKFQLARADYDVNLVPEINDTNLIELSKYRRLTWEGTTNQVRVRFNHRDDEYKDTFGLAQDMANVQIQGRDVSTTASMPGVKDPTLADAIAWRKLRTQAFPIVNVEAIVGREFYSVHPGDVLALTSAEIGVVKLPVRVNRIDHGELQDGRIKLGLTQDIFRAAAGVYGPVPETGWTLPLDELAPFPVDQQEAIEAPRAITFRDPDSVSAETDKVYAWARQQGVEVSFDVVERHAAGTPLGSFSLAGEVYGFALLAELLADLPAGSVVPHASLTLTTTPDTQAALLAALPTTSTPIPTATVGTELRTLIAVGNEFMLPLTAQASGPNVQLNDVYRGVLDSVQENHLAGDDVWLVFVGANITEGTVPAGDNVDVKLLPRSSSDVVEENDATTISFQMDDRTRRPYPPSELDLNGTRFASTASLEGSGSGEDTGIGVSFDRRDFRTADGGDEIAALGNDAPNIFPDYPSANSTTHEADVVDDPDGTPATLFVENFASANSGTVRRLDVLEQNGGVVPTRMRLNLRSKHTLASVLYASRYDLVWDFDVTSELSGSFNLGVLDVNDDSNDFTVTDDATDHDFTISSAFSSGDVEYRVNGGTWTTLISASEMTGSVPNASINNGDTLEVRHTSTDTDAQKLLTMDVGASAFVAHAVLVT